MKTKKSQTKVIKVSEIPNIINGINREFSDALYKKTITEKKCYQWISILGVCTLVIKKLGVFTDYYKAVDKLKEKVNLCIDTFLDNRLGKIEF